MKIVNWNDKVILTVAFMVVLLVGSILTWGKVINNYHVINPTSPSIVTDPPLNEKNDIEQEELEEKQDQSMQQEPLLEENISLEDGLTVELLRKLNISDSSISIDRLLNVLKIK